MENERRSKQHEEEAWPLKPKSLKRIAENLHEALRESQDIRLVPYFAEYLVGYFLSIEGSKFGYDVEVLGKKRGSDILIRDNTRNICKAVEIKTGHTDRTGLLCGASFGKGTSIKERKFSSCVFVVFEKLQVKDYLVFSENELEGVCEKKRGMFPNNPCNLFWCENLQEYERQVPFEDRLDVEKRLHTHPEDFRNRWDKIFSELDTREKVKS
jgi:hypothetical protein